MLSHKRILLLRQSWRFGLLIAAVLLIATSAAALATAGHLRSQIPSNQRVFVTAQNETDPAVVALASDLQKRGFTVIKGPANLSSLNTSDTRSVVLTASAFHGAPADTLRALYEKGAIIAAVNVSMPDLAAELEPNGPSRPSMPGLHLSTPPASAWLPTSPGYTLFSMMGPGVKGSDVLRSPASFASLLERYGPGRILPRGTPPAPFVPGPSPSPTP